MEKNPHCTCTPEARAAWSSCDYCVASSVFSDVYKEANGFRPRFHGDWTMEELLAATHRLYDEADARAVEDAMPIVPVAGAGWAVVTPDPEGLRDRLDRDYSEG